MAYKVNNVNSDGIIEPTVSTSGTTGSVQYNNGSAGLSGASYVEITNGNLCLHDPGGVPESPVGDKIIFFGEKVAGRVMPAYVGPSGLDSVLQPFLARNKIGYWNPIGNANTAIVGFGIAAPSGSGTATSVSVATTGIAQQTKRLRYAVTTASTSAVAGVRIPAAQFWRGNGTGLGGFNLVVRFVPGGQATPATQRIFCGMANSTAAPTDADPSTIANTICVGADATDTNFFIMHNGGSGVATRIDLGANFPKNNAGTDLYELSLFAKSNDTVVSYEFRRLNTGNVASGTISTNLPSNTTLLAPRLWASVGGTNSTVGIDIVSLYIETDY